METISKKVVSIEFQGRKYVLSDEMTLENFLTSLGLEENGIVKLQPSRDGFVLDIK